MGCTKTNEPDEPIDSEATNNITESLISGVFYSGDLDFQYFDMSREPIPSSMVAYKTTRLYFFKEGYCFLINSHSNKSNAGWSFGEVSSWYKFEIQDDKTIILKSIYNSEKYTIEYREDKLIFNNKITSLTSENENLFFSEFREGDNNLLNIYKPHSGKSGNISYKFEPWNNSLILEGNGDMANYSDSKQTPWNKNADKIKKISLSNSVTSIGSYAFAELVSLKELSYGHSLKSIGDHAFEGCSNLSVSFSNNDFENLKEIGQYAFSDCKSVDLKDISLGGNLKKIGRNAFGDVALNNVSFKEGLEEIGIGEGKGVTFNNWPSEVVLPNSVRRIGSSTFKGNFSKIEIGTQIQSMDSKAFITSAKSGDFYINSETPPTCPNSLIVDDQDNSVTSSWVLHAPEKAESSYKTSEGWCNFKSINNNTQDSSENPSEPTSEDELLSTKLIGKWKYSDRFYEYYYFFAENGQGYYQTINSDAIPGIYRSWIADWKIENGTLCLKYVGATSYTKITKFEFISDSQLILRSETLSRVNNHKELDISFKKEPYDNYIKYLGTSYPLDYVKKQMIHSSGTDNNEKYLRFQGLDQDVWYDIRYFTPYYEGIDNYWLDGTFRVNTVTSVMTSCWQYIGIPCKKFSGADDINGKLTIKHTNNYYTYSYKSTDFEIYFEGIEK